MLLNNQQIIEEIKKEIKICIETNENENTTTYLLSKTMGCFSGWLMSSASVQKLFCGVCSELKCSFDESVGEKVVSLAYFSTILGLPPFTLMFMERVSSSSLLCGLGAW